MSKPIAIIGYSGHSHTGIDILTASGYTVTAYCDNEPKDQNPFNLLYLGSEKDADVIEKLKAYDYFIGIGNNNPLRRKVYEAISPVLGEPLNAIHPSAIISPSVKLSHGHFISANVSINALTELGKTAVCNTGSVIEHGCIIGDFTFIAPGAVLNGDVMIGENTFVGANSVIKQGVKVGKNVIIGAGAVILKDVPDGVTIVGNPGRIISQK
ncbi:MAG TPA: acetyltransferase [Chitinophagaceae bacterium]|nr:acetyltransferase [Chitinophagaceae bacterium]